METLLDKVLEGKEKGMLGCKIHRCIWLTKDSEKCPSCEEEKSAN